MKPLNQTIYSPRGFSKMTFKQVEKSNLGFIYEQFSVLLEQVIGYHVFEKKINNLFQCESYPGPDAFGVWAWQFRNLKEAKEKFNNLYLIEHKTRK